MKRNILIVLSLMITMMVQAAVPMEIWTPRVHNPVFAEPGGEFTVEMKGAQELSSKGWKASVHNDLKAWPCVVKKAVWGRIHHATEDGWLLTVSLPAKISPELMALDISNGNDKAVSVRAVNIVPDFKQDFYILHQSDQHIAEDQAVEPGGKSSKKWGVGSKDALQWMTPVVNLINPRFIAQTGDNMHLYFEYNYWCGMDTAKQRVQRFLDGLAGLTVPFVLSTGNHDIGWKNYILVKEWRKEYTEHLMGQRAFSFRMGSFYVLNTEWTVEEDYLTWAKADYAKAKADPKVQFQLQLAHFYNGPEGTPTVTATGDSSDLMIVGHNHQTKTLQTSPYYVLSVGTAQDHQRAAFYNFHHTATGWTSAQVKTHANDVNVHHLVGDNGTPKVAATYDNANDGAASSNTVHIKNELPHDFYDGRIRFLLKQGQYNVTGGKVLAQYDYNDGKNSAVVVKVDIKESNTTIVSIQPK
ncbi:hypothetical protein GFS24_03700 [Chitinophaga sp. SYP-B3965]|uniref:metallophosphoesterase family protein n=1 Tax=Chitinophaga sp. SYP-B3965 TaxID=2663120 RepID=UPI0012996A77|nr:metallophosphoesterase [Chitinophaga sp. SYP-B3965]MRG44201.1 hypothetical protein [Chitinophaga sp. SYP-B3965]